MATRQSKVNTIIDKYGESITVTDITGSSYSEDTGWSNTGTSTSATYVIPYDYFSGNQDFKEQGNLEKGQIRLIVKGNFSIGERDTFVYRTKTYSVTRVNPLPFDGEYLAQVIEANEVL